MKKPLRVGFDLDGVLLYNPARIFRPLISRTKKNVLHNDPHKFYVPKKSWEKLIWRLFHLSSIFIAPGFNDIKQLVEENKIEAYLVTARYSFLKPDLDMWLKRLNFNKYFKLVFYNKDDEQPHLYKEKTIKDLGLDIFVEDNWDIVHHLSEQTKKKPEFNKLKVFWIFNLLDRHIPYEHKFPTLKAAVLSIQKQLPHTKQ